MNTNRFFAVALSSLLLINPGHAQESISGVGVVLGVKDHAIKILRVFPDSPAAKAGLTAGLTVHRINGTPTDKKLLKDCVDMLRGPVGTKVNLELTDAAGGQTSRVELTREPLSVLSTPRSSRPTIYDEHAQGANQIAEALAQAKTQDKRVLLQFGANWCGWCHKLHKLFENDPAIAARLKDSYVVVMVDVNQGHNADIDRRYGHPTRFGLPVLVVLDATGKVLTTQDTGKLEAGDHHDPKKVLAFLDQWSGKGA